MKNLGYVVRKIGNDRRRDLAANLKRDPSPRIIERGGSMPTKEQLQKRVQELQEENDQLQDQLDQIYDIVAPPEGQDERDRG